MKIELEAYYMNKLPFSLRAAAHDVYVYENIDELVRMRFNKVDNRYLQDFSLNASQWQEVLDTAILTKLSQLKLGNHLSMEEFLQLDYLLKAIFNMVDADRDEVTENLENAPHLQNWYQQLRKCIRENQPA